MKHYLSEDIFMAASEPSNPFQINNKLKMKNFVLLKDSYDSLTFDSYDLIPNIQTVYWNKNHFYQVSEEQIEYQTHEIYSQWQELLSKFSYFYFYNGFS